MTEKKELVQYRTTLHYQASKVDQLNAEMIDDL